MQEDKVQYKYVYRDFRDQGRNRVVTDRVQLEGLTGLKERTLTGMFSKGDVHYHRYGRYSIERMVYLKSERKRR